LMHVVLFFFVENTLSCKSLPDDTRTHNLVRGAAWK